MLINFCSLLVMQILDLFSMLTICCYLTNFSILGNFRKVLLINTVFSFFYTIFEIILSDHAIPQLALSIISIMLLTVLFSKLVFNINTIDYLISFSISYAAIVAFELLMSYLFPILSSSGYGIYIIIGILLLVTMTFILLQKYFPIAFFLRFIENINFIVKIVILNELLITTVITIIFKADQSNYVELFYNIMIFFVLTAFVNIELVVSKYKQLKEQSQIALYEEYLPIIDELIDEIRERQHDYNNQLQSLKMLPYTYTSIDELRLTTDTAIDNYSNNASSDYRFLTMNYHLLSGLLLSKSKFAKQHGYDLQITVSDSALKSQTPEYKLVQVIGILIDNALEHTTNAHPIYIDVDSKNDKLLFSIKNAGPIASAEFIHNIFKKGYSTKPNPSNHGLGLYNARKIINETNGNIQISNLQIHNTTYLLFEIEL